LCSTTRSYRRTTRRHPHASSPASWACATKVPSRASLRCGCDTLTLDFDNDTNFESHHYAFKVDESEFDEIFERVRAEGIAYGSGPGALDDMKINRRRGGRGFYFRDPNGHVLEVLTA